MLSKIKQLLDPQKEELWGDERPNNSLIEKELHQLHTENEALRDRLNLLQSQSKSLRMHVELFYFHPHASKNSPFSENDLDHLPVMCVTVHFMEIDKPAPHWIRAMLTGVEQTLTAMKVHYRKVAEPQLYSIFVDTKLYPHQEVKKVVHVLIKQLNELQEQEQETITTRVHVGGDELYQDLLDAYAEQAV